MLKRYFSVLSAVLFASAALSAQTIIPVVFHVVWKTAAQNIPDSCLQDQLDVLNEDYNAANADIVNVPAAWQPIIGNMNVQFVLATTDPNGNPTTGIERRQTTVTSWTGNNNVCYYSMGGLDAWPDTTYLNIWICNISGGVLGYAQLPGGPAATDGVLLHYSVTGRGSYAMAPFNLGRAGTHMLGHWFGLVHFGPDNNCSYDTDNIPDTPTYSSTTLYGTYAPGTVLTDACNPTAPGIMWMNFMTEVDDASMCFFTQDQTDTMTWVLNNLKLGNGVTTSAGKNLSANQSFSLFPSPSNGIISVQRSLADAPATLTVYNAIGAVVAEGLRMEAGEKNKSLDFSTLPAGIYNAVLMEDGVQSVRRFSIAR